MSAHTVKRKLRTYTPYAKRYNVRMTDSFPIAEKLKQIRIGAGVSLREMARRMNMPPSSYNHYETPSRFKDAFLPADFAENFAMVIGDKDAARKIFELTYQPSMDEILEGFKAIEDEPVTPSRVQVGEDSQGLGDLVPVYSVQASAGHGSDISEEYQEYTLAFPANYLQTLTTSNPKNLSIISVKGDSMEPTILDNDIVLLDRSKTDLNFDGLFVLRFGDALHIKRIGRASAKNYVTILSDNRELYPPIQSAITEIEAVGKVLWYGRKV